MRPKRTVSVATQQSIQDAAENVILDQDDKADIDVNSLLGAEDQDDTNYGDDDWTNGLTPITVDTPPVDSVRQQNLEQQVQQPVSQQSVQQSIEQQNLNDLWESLDHVDSDVAAEIHNKIIAPELDPLNKRLQQIEQRYAMEEQKRAEQKRAETNKALFERHKGVDKILGSVEFRTFVESTTSPYATESNFDVLSRAYHSGDVEYVSSVINSFIQARGKPKAAVSAEPQQGGGHTATTASGKRTITAEQYRAARHKILTAPRGTYPPGALRELADKYIVQRGK